MKKILTTTLLLLLTASTAVIASDYRYIDGPKVDKYTLSLCEGLDKLYSNSKSNFIKNQVKANIHNSCGFRYVKSLNWYITKGKYIPRGYGNLFSSNAVKRKYLDLMAPTRI